MKSIVRLAPLLCLAIGAALPAAAAERMTGEALSAYVKKVDDRANKMGEMQHVNYLQDKGPDGTLMRHANVYVRDGGEQFLMLFTQPSNLAGSGYLLIGRNIWLYDHKVGKWERRTMRERLGGSGARYRDLGSFALAKDYEATDEGVDMLGKRQTRKLLFKAKEGAEVDYPVLRIWFDQNHDRVKEESFALSGKLLRTTYITKRAKAVHPGTGEELLVPTEVRAFDELEKGRETVITFPKYDFSPLDPNIFTKAWVEGQTR